MATKHASSGDLIDLRPLGAPLDDSQSTTLLRDEQLNIMRLAMPAGQELNDHWRSLMREIKRSELVAWLKVIPARMSCLVDVAPELPRAVLVELLNREWATYANDGRLVRTDKGHSVTERE